MITTALSMSLAAVGVALLITGPNEWPAIVAANICFISAAIMISGAKFPAKHP